MQSNSKAPYISHVSLSINEPNHTVTNGHLSSNSSNIVKNTVKLLETNKTSTLQTLKRSNPSRAKRSSSIDNVLNENSNDKYLYEILQNIYDQNKNDVKQRPPSPSISNTPHRHHHYSNTSNQTNNNNKQYLNDENNYKYLTPPNSGNDIESSKVTSRSKSLNRDYSYLDQQQTALGKRKPNHVQQPYSRHYNNNNKYPNYYHDDQSSCSSFTSTTPHVPKPPPGNPQRVSNQQGR